MPTSRFYLRQDVQAEPLVDQWYAWSYLLPPATAARNLSERHLKIMDSYVASPHVHAAAVKNPKLAGGPFIDYGGRRVDEVRALRDRTRRERAHMLELSAALSELDRNLRAKAKGYSLAPLYREVPEILKGYVELVYDLNNNPSFRLLEPLLYRSKYYDRSLQSLMLSLSTGDDRPFLLSTPRLAGDDLLHVERPFDHESIDALFRTKSSARSRAEIADLLGVDGDDHAGRLLDGFLTEQAPPPYEPYAGDGLRWRYFGHACILVESGGASLLFDPVLSYSYPSSVPRYTYLDLPERIDYVLITHNHQDHVLLETLLQIRHKIGCILVPRNVVGSLQDPSLALLLRHAGFRNVQELAPMERVTVGGMAVTGLPFLGEHSDLDIGTKLAFLVRSGRHSLLFAADCCNLEPRLYDHVQREVGDVEVVFLGMECDGAPLSWLYGPLLTQHLERGMDESRRLAGSDFEQARALVDGFGCKEVYVYAMGQEPWLNYVMSLEYTATSRPIVESDRLVAYCRERGIVAERMFGQKEMLMP